MANYDRRFNATCYTVPALVDTCRMTTTSLTMRCSNSKCALWHRDQNYIFINISLTQAWQDNKGFKLKPAKLFSFNKQHFLMVPGGFEVEVGLF
eukprot:11055613-Ditylum_brightwellii.AAC.1